MENLLTLIPESAYNKHIILCCMTCWLKGGNMINIDALDDTINTTDLRRDTRSVLKRVRSGRPVALINNSQIAAIMVDPDLYKRMAEAYARSNAKAAREVADQRRNEPTLTRQQAVSRLRARLGVE